MDFNKLQQKKTENWTVWVTVDNEDLEVEYVPIPEGYVSDKKRTEIINSQLNKKYGTQGWLAYNVDSPTT